MTFNSGLFLEFAEKISSRIPLNVPVRCFFGEGDSGTVQDLKSFCTISADTVCVSLRRNTWCTLGFYKVLAEWQFVAALSNVSR